MEARIAQLEAELNAQKHPAMVNAAMPQGSGEATSAEPAATKTETPPPPDPFAGLKTALAGVTFSGLVDTYYGYNVNHPTQHTTFINNVNGGTGGFISPTGTITEPFSFRNDRFGLNLVELQLDKPVDKSSPFGFRVALGFGDAMTAIENSSNLGSDGQNSSTQYLKEGYMSYLAPIGKGLQLDFGKWVTPNGAEVIETNQNWNYSRSLLFYYAIPYYHMGARAKYTFNDKIAVAGYATNGWNNVVSSNSGKTGGFSLIITPNKRLGFTQNFMTGPRDVFAVGAATGKGDNDHWNNLADTVVTFNATSKLSLIGNFDYDHQDFGGGAGADYTGVAGYVRYQISPKVAFIARAEYLNDHDGFATGFAQHLWETTGTIERVFANHLIARAEYRHDESNHDFFPYGSSGAFVSAQDTAKIGLVFVLQPAQ